MSLADSLLAFPVPFLKVGIKVFWNHTIIVRVLF